MKDKKLLLGVFVCILASMLLLAVSFFSANSTEEQVLYQLGRTIVSQTPRSMEFTMRKAQLPVGVDFAATDSETDYKIPVYSDETTTIFLKSIYYANGDTEYLSADFYCRYTLPVEGRLLSIYTTDYSSGKNKPLFTSNLYPTDRTVRDGQTVFDDAVSLHGTGTSEYFSVYIRTDAFRAAKDQLTFTLDGFNNIVYRKG